MLRQPELKRGDENISWQFWIQFDSVTTTIERGLLCMWLCIHNPIVSNRAQQQPPTEPIGHTAASPPAAAAANWLRSLHIASQVVITIQFIVDLRLPLINTSKCAAH